jgi:hypothetical protein
MFFLSKNVKILRGLFFSKKQIPRGVLHLRFLRDKGYPRISRINTDLDNVPFEICLKIMRFSIKSVLIREIYG